jgi:hypothetical protein
VKAVSPFEYGKMVIAIFDAEYINIILKCISIELSLIYSCTINMQALSVSTIVLLKLHCSVVEITK